MRNVDRREFVHRAAIVTGAAAAGIWSLKRASSGGKRTSPTRKRADMRTVHAATEKAAEPGEGISAKIVIRPDQTVATINPNIYGHFAEHLGRCIYDGIWVGPDSSVPNEGGFRTAVIDALKRLRAPVVRWPGGCFADAYHWQDGVGPLEKRPRRSNLWWEGEEPNSFGTNEFIEFCRKIGAAPYICANLGSGSPEEALGWMEYCNSRQKTRFATMRAQNGHPEPYGVMYWGVGNENWGCGGCFDAESYAKEYKRFATYLKRASFQTGAQLIACGHTTKDWNPKFFEVLRWMPQLVDHISIHHYFTAGGDIEFSDDDYYTMLADLALLEKEIQEATAAIDDFTGGKRSVGLIIDEWGVWHPQATTQNGLEQQNTLRDALFAGSALNLFNKYASRIPMTNIAQTINVLQCVAFTKGAETILTPTYHVFDMYKEHMGAQLVATEVEAPSVKVPRSKKRASEEMSAMDVSASVNKKRLFVTIVNKHLTSPLEMEIELSSDGEFRSGSLKELISADVRDHNEFGQPDVVKPISRKLKASGRSFRYVMPAHSVTAFKFELV